MAGIGAGAGAGPAGRRFEPDGGGKHGAGGDCRPAVDAGAVQTPNTTDTRRGDGDGTRTLI